MRIGLDEPLEIRTTDLISMLSAYKMGILPFEGMMDWVNVIWFSDSFGFNESQIDSIGSVLTVIEELDQEYRIFSNEAFTHEVIDRYIEALRNNQEIY